MKRIPGFEQYMVSKEGEIYKDAYSLVRSDGVNYSREVRKLRLHRCPKGYIKCDLHKEGKNYPMKLHRIIAMTYIPNPLNYPQVNHINGVKDDNRIENLEWCTNSQNQLHSNRVLGNRKTMTGKEVIDLETGIFYKSCTDAYKAYNLNYRFETFCGKIRNNKLNRFTHI